MVPHAPSSPSDHTPLHETGALVRLLRSLLCQGWMEPADRHPYQFCAESYLNPPACLASGKRVARPAHAADYHQSRCHQYPEALLQSSFPLAFSLFHSARLRVPPPVGVLAALAESGKPLLGMYLEGLRPRRPPVQVRRAHFVPGVGTV